MLDGTAIPGSDKGLPCPNPFRDPPSEALKIAKSLYRGDSGFLGRIGALVYAQEGQLYALYAKEPAPTLPRDYRLLSESMLWPTMSFRELADCDLVDGNSQGFSLLDFVRKGLCRFPLNDANHGGCEMAWRRGAYIFAMHLAMGSPSACLLQTFNRNRVNERLVALGEWWCGEALPYDVRFDGTFYAPRSSGRELVERLLAGHEVGVVTNCEVPKAEVLYEDASLLIVNKPPRLASVPSATEPVDCLSMMSRDFGLLFDVHRLDMATSGVLVFARSRRMQRLMQENFRSGHVQKRYVALLWGDVKEVEGTVVLPLGVNRLDRPRQCVLPPCAGAKDACTRFEVLGKTTRDGQPLTRIALCPQTGRTHQLRVHCAHSLGLNAPIVGDAFYGKEGVANESWECRMHLHAKRILFSHPDTHRSFEIAAPCGF